VANKDKISEYHALYYEKNKDKICKQQTEYRQANIDKIHQKFDCDCGGRYTYKGKARHFKSRKHQQYIANQQQKIKYE
jgi:hypothetical protein